MEVPSVTVAVTVTTEGAGGVIYDEAEALVVVALVPLVDIANAWNAENECELGSAGALTVVSHLSIEPLALDLTTEGTYLRRPFLAHNDLAADNKTKVVL
jgi:hypothetical protein